MFIFATLSLADFKTTMPRDLADKRNDFLNHEQRLSRSSASSRSESSPHLVRRPAVRREPAHRCPKLRMTAVADSAGLSSSAGAAAQGRSFSYENLMGKALDTGQIVYMDAHWVFACFSPRQGRRRETPYKPRELAGQPLLARKTDLHRYDLSLKNCATLR